MRELEIPLAAPLRALDVGGGSGVLRDQVEASTAWVVDLADLNAAALAAVAPGRGRVLCYDVLAPCAELLGSYDVVLLFDVIEHVEDTGPFLRAVAGHLRPGGHLLVNVPAGQALYGAYDRAAGHLRRYDRRTLGAAVSGTDLSVRALRYWGLSLVPLLLARRWLVRGGPATIRQGFAPPGPATHALLRLLLRVETSLLRRPPLGSSLLMGAQRRPAGGGTG